MRNIFFKYITPTILGFFAAWSAWYLFFYNGTSDLWTTVAILYLEFSILAFGFVVGFMWFDL